ncbi:MAG TPA: hypothetical protein VE996_07575 [Terriglobales bacterium]|nr:hypothetical protein [Terriglobales bacterium]
MAVLRFGAVGALVFAAGLAGFAASAAPQPRQYQLALQFTGARVAATATVALRVPERTAWFTFRLAPGLAPGDLATGGQTYRPLRIARGLYQVVLATPWAAGSEQRVVLHYAGTVAAPDVISSRRVVLLPGTNWYPAWTADGRFTVTLRVAAPADLRIATRGELIGTDERGWRTWADPAAAHGIGLILEPLDEREIAAPGLTVAVFSRTAGALQPLARALAGAVSTCRRRWGEPRYRPAEINLVAEAGVDSARMAGNWAMVPQGEAAPSLALLRGITSWWWARPDTPPWLEAGLETISALDLLAERQGENARDAWLPRLQAAAQDTGAPPLALAQARTAQNAAVAARAGLVLNALRWEIGPDRFAGLLRAWARTPPAADARAGQARFERLAQEIGGERLDWFWRQWLQRPDWPRIDFEWRMVRLPRSGQTVRVRVRQPAPAFDFRAPILIVAGGRRYWQTIQVRNRDTILGIPVRGTVDSVQFDPEDELPRWRGDSQPLE